MTQPVSTPPGGVNVEHGESLVEISGCRNCHGADLAGGSTDGFGPPAGPNLTVIVPSWTEAEFVQTLRTGTDTTGRQINAEAMPWPAFSAAFTDDELAAMYTYLRELPAVQRIQ